MLTDEELYEGFQPEEVESMRREVKARWGEDQLKATEDRLHELGADGWKDQKEKETAVHQLLADLLDFPADHPQVQAAIKHHFELMNTYYEVSEDRYRGLGDMYTIDDRFRAFYDKFRPGMAEFMKAAMHAFCDQHFKK